MNKMLVVLFLLTGAWHLSGADMPLIPPALNNVLPKIEAGMTTNQVRKLLSTAYPHATAQLSNWSGMTGYIDYKLDDRYSLSVASINKETKMFFPVVHTDLLFYVYDTQAKHRIQIAQYDWDSVPHKAERPKSPGQ